MSKENKLPIKTLLSNCMSHIANRAACGNYYDAWSEFQSLIGTLKTSQCPLVLPGTFRVSIPNRDAKNRRQPSHARA